MTPRRVAVTGLGVVSPLGNDPADFFDGLVHGRPGIRHVPLGREGRTTKAIGAPVSFAAPNHFALPQLRMLDRVSQFALVGAGQAAADAGLDICGFDRAGAGVFIGTALGGAETTDDGYFTFYGERSDRVKPYSVLMAMNNAVKAFGVTTRTGSA